MYHNVIFKIFLDKPKLKPSNNNINNNILAFFRFLPGLLPDAIKTDCSKCNPAQKRNSKKVISFLRTRKPQDWKALTDKYDPEGLFKKRIESGQIWMIHNWNSLAAFYLCKKNSIKICGSRDLTTNKCQNLSNFTLNLF